MNMVASRSVRHFWSAVEDCLVTFHRLEPSKAAVAVTSLLHRLPTSLNDGDTAFADMIYHAEPWQIACNLAGNDIAIAAHQSAYQALLRRNELASAG